MERNSKGTDRDVVKLEKHGGILSGATGVCERSMIYNDFSSIVTPSKREPAPNALRTLRDTAFASVLRVKICADNLSGVRAR